MLKRIKYVDENKMVISFSSLVFNVKSINEKFGPLIVFAEKFGLTGETNGKLFYLSEFTEAPSIQYKRIEKYLKPLGFVKGEDFFYIIKHPSSDIKVKHPSCVSIAWLGSEINPEGNFLWFREVSKTLSLTDTSKAVIYKNQPQYNGEGKLTFKILDSMDPKPGFQGSRFTEVPYEKFILFEENCLPVFLPTAVGTFPEEIFPEALEGQRIALFYHNKLPITTTIFQIVDGSRTNKQIVWVEANFTDQ